MFLLRRFEDLLELTIPQKLREDTVAAVCRLARGTGITGRVETAPVQDSKKLGFWAV
jgi:hypothetical protein